MCYLRPTTYLLLDQLVLLPKPRHHGGGDEEARPGDSRTAGDDPGVRGHTREEALYPSEQYVSSTWEGATSSTAILLPPPQLLLLTYLLPY